MRISASITRPQPSHSGIAAVAHGHFFVMTPEMLPRNLRNVKRSALSMSNSSGLSAGQWPNEKS
jgi:hypothetical protein